MNGNFLRSAIGSTLRADAVAQRDERAGITCYLINGVCHQASNRILAQSNITVDGARGYSLSVSLFGVFGRKRGALGLCRAPFDDFQSISGDLPACVGKAVPPSERDVIARSNPGLHDFEDAYYMSEVLELYDNEKMEVAENANSLFHVQMRHFKLFVNHKLGRPHDKISEDKYRLLMEARGRFEESRLLAEERFAATDNRSTFVEQFDELTLKFQAEVAEILDGETYFKLLNLPRHQRIVLSNVDIVGEEHGPSGAAS